MKCKAEVMKSKCSLCGERVAGLVVNSNVCSNCYKYLKEKYGDEFTGIW